MGVPSALAEATESKKHLTHDGAKVSVNRHFQKVMAEQYYRQFRPNEKPTPDRTLGQRAANVGYEGRGKNVQLPFGF
jgi:hypothetical protein